MNVKQLPKIIHWLAHVFYDTRFGLWLNMVIMNNVYKKLKGRKMDSFERKMYVKLYR